MRYDNYNSRNYCNDGCWNNRDKKYTLERILINLIKTSCKEYVEIRKKTLKEEISKFKRKPCLVVIQVDDDPASTSYIKGKKKDCEEVGIVCEHIHINSEEVREGVLACVIGGYGVADNVDGIIIQLPIPDKYNLDRLLENIPAAKDVDGFRRDSCFKPCTPKGIMDWLDYNKVELSGKDVCVIGRSNIVGKPLVNMMIDAGATVACCNSKTKDLKYYTRNADIVVSAIGKAKYFDSTYFKQGQIIVDVGINRDENGKLCGDVDGKYVYDSYVTSVPGGVGLLTRNALIENVVTAYKLQNGE